MSSTTRPSIPERRSSASRSPGMTATGSRAIRTSSSTRCERAVRRGQPPLGRGRADLERRHRDVPDRVRSRPRCDDRDRRVDRVARGQFSAASHVSLRMSARRRTTAPPSGGPLVTRTRTIAVTLIVIAAIAVGGYIAWDQVLRGDDVASLALPSSAPSAERAPPAPHRRLRRLPAVRRTHRRLRRAMAASPGSGPSAPGASPGTACASISRTSPRSPTRSAGPRT